MSKVGFFISEHGNKKEVLSFGDKHLVDLTPEEASALAVIYLSDKIGTYLERFDNKLNQICDKINDIETAVDALRHTTE